MKRLLLAALPLVPLFLDGCAIDSETQGAPAPTVTETVTETVVAEPSSVPTEPTGTVPPPPEPPADTEAPPTTYDEARTRLDTVLDTTGEEPQDLLRFESTTGVYCLLDSDFAIGCELPSGGIPDPDYCGDAGASQSVGRVVFLDGAPVPECNSDTIREPGAPEVEVGSVAASSATGVQCLVEAAGVTCLDPARTQGFFLGPEAYTVFTAG